MKKKDGAFPCTWFQDLKKTIKRVFFFFHYYDEPKFSTGKMKQQNKQKRRVLLGESMFIT